MKKSLPELLKYCTKHEIRLAHDNVGGLTVDAPPGTITPDVLNGLRTHKHAILHYLRNGEIILAKTATVADVQEALAFFNQTQLQACETMLD